MASSEGFGRQPAFEPPCVRRCFSRAAPQRVAAAPRPASPLLTAEDGGSPEALTPRTPQPQHRRHRNVHLTILIIVILVLLAIYLARRIL
jgi:hypothetical protein